jgi:GNAT superfamily N-acetyltransferase
MLHEVGLREAVKIKRMRVDPTYGRRGYGRAILAALERRAAELGFDTLHLATGAPQESARHLYEGSGYREVRRGMVGPIKSIFCEKNLA